MTLRVGLTGGIGSGKSTVADMFARLGAPVIDTDLIAHQLTAPHGEAMPLIQAEFGDDFLDAQGGMDRSKMRKLVFSDLTAKSRLEQILHPLIFSHVQSQIAQHARSPYLVIVIPLLFESGIYQALLDHIISVDCDESLQILRTTRRSQLSESEVRAIMDNQTTREIRNRSSDDLIVNNGSIPVLEGQVLALHRKLLSPSAHRH